MKIPEFINLIATYYASNKRHFAWRDVENPYYVFISEVMLQQTQTQRVIEKFAHFIEVFPTIHELANAPLSAVLLVWQGLGYNRRGKFLHQAAGIIVNQYNGIVPEDPSQLVKLPGIGAATAASIAAFAYNKPTIFIETNIRAVYLHSFFPKQEKVSDAELMPFIEQSLDHSNPRQWYYALMDYGVMLKKMHKNPSRKSKHHTKQSPFEGSIRQIRGSVLRLILQHSTLCVMSDLHTAVMADIKRPVTTAVFESVIAALVAEGMIVQAPDGLLALQ
jgi:A/G-specific adenine glycosylase